MRKSLLITQIITLLFFLGGNTSKAENQSASPVNLIFDTDLGPDYDDVGTMALLHALADNGEVNILATLSSNHHENVVPCIEVLNFYFNRPDIPVGTPKSEGGANLTTWHKVKWTEILPAKYPHKTKKTADAPDAVKVYRRLLSEQPDKSVVICTVGFFTNLKDLLDSGPDEYSQLSGNDLISRKVKHLVSMAGLFPEGREFNVYCDTPSSEKVFDNWPTEIIFSGFEIGNEVFTGKRLVQMPVENSPVKETYELCFAEGDPDGRMSWDQTTALVAVKGYAPYFSTERGVLKVIDSEGTNKWTPDTQGKHIRLIKKMPFEELAVLIENYMMHQPSSK